MREDITISPGRGRRFLRAIIAALLGPVLLTATTAQAKSPAPEPTRNVVFILSDDHRYDFMGFHPNAPPFLETPNMDRMAAGGVHLANAFVTTALCSPSRATILTGQYAHRHGVVDNQRPVPEGTVFFPKYLQDAGYRTAFIGKWHMGHEHDDPRPGFHHWISFRGQGPYFDPTLNINGKRIPHQGYTADILTDYALEWLREQAGNDGPFFLYLSHKNVHAEFEPAKRHLGRYEDVEPRYPETMADTEENYRGKPRWVREQRDSWHGVDYMYHGRMDFDTFYRRYCEALLSLDESVGRVLDYLEAAGLAESTLVVYMGDNGFMFGEHGLIDKRHAYDPSWRVPLLAYAPGLIEPGSRITENVQNTDIAPTILEFAGVSIPTQMEGRSFLPLLRGENVPWREEIFYEYYWEWNFPHTPTTFALRTDRHKYIFYHGVWDTDELYDISEDREERVNLIGRPEHEELARDLRRRLFDWLRESAGLTVQFREPTGFRADQRSRPD
jgi:N-acetylglucosamine-6-sulfatase